MRDFHVKAIQHRGKIVWAIVRHEPGREPATIGVHYSDPAVARVDANRLNLYADARKKRRGAPDAPA
jgi:hypothetical protein